MRELEVCGEREWSVWRRSGVRDWSRGQWGRRWKVGKSEVGEVRRKD